MCHFDCWARVPFLIGKLRSHKLRGAARWFKKRVRVCSISASGGWLEPEDWVQASGVRIEVICKPSGLSQRRDISSLFPQAGISKSATRSAMWMSTWLLLVEDLRASCLGNLGLSSLCKEELPHAQISETNFGHVCANSRWLAFGYSLCSRGWDG